MTDVEIIVIGDVYWDTVVVPLPSDQGAERPENAYIRMDRPAGALLLETLIKKATNSNPSIEVKGYGTVKNCYKNTEIETLHAFRTDDVLKPDQWRRALSVMDLCPKSDTEEKEEVYRVRPKERLGWVAYPGADNEPWFTKEQTKLGDVYKQLNSAVSPGTNPAHRIVVISETKDHKFRQVPDNATLVKILTTSPKSWLVFCMASPLGEGALWNTIKKSGELLQRTLVIISAASLRSGRLYVREQAAQETIAFELAVKFQNPNIQDLINCGHIVVRFDYDSAFHFEKGKVTFDNYLRPFEGGPQTNPGRYGTMSGYGKILAASIIKEMADSILESSKPSALFKLTHCQPFGRLDKAICDGLRRGAAHFINRFAAKGFETDYLTKGKEPTPFVDLFNQSSGTPIKELFRQSYIAGDGTPKEKVDLPLLARVHLPFDVDKLQYWSRVQGFKEHIGAENFKRCLINVVKFGLLKALEEHKVSISDLPDDELPIDCPFLKLGDLISIERKELDGFNDVYVLIQKYLQDDSSKKPLSLAVFGPPGSGKSFAVKQILKAAGSKSATVELENNLSQFTEAKNLARAFHRAQDVALSGKVPLVFFDEFDASLPDNPYAWLKYFLAPMQDGKFKAAESEDGYTVGRAIFVFAGGTAATFKDFENSVRSKKSAKGPDFISRLRGHLNIQPVNEEPTKPRTENGEKPTLRERVQAILRRVLNKKSKAKPIDNCRLLLRRAIILRSILEREAREIIDSKKQARIDDGVINAFLYIDRYEHETRSMEAIVKMARPDKGYLRVASLRSSEQLGMHVDAKLFLELARGEKTPPECGFPSERKSAANSGSSALGWRHRRVHNAAFSTFSTVGRDHGLDDLRCQRLHGRIDRARGEKTRHGPGTLRPKRGQDRSIGE
jgi:ATPase family associated with various cellular activities (AAA)